MGGLSRNLRSRAGTECPQRTGPAVDVRQPAAQAEFVENQLITRFGQHTVDESMRDLARAALRQLRGELEEEARAE